MTTTVERLMRTPEIDPFADLPANGREPADSGVIRRLLASSNRARAHWQTKSPGIIVCKNKLGGVPTRAKEVVAHAGTLPAAWRRVKVIVHPEGLSQPARAILLASAEPDNRHRSSDYRFETGLTWAQVFHPDPESEQVWGRSFWAQPFLWTLHWPQLQDTESGEAYYERCARLIELTRYLFRADVPPGRIAGLVGSAERFGGEWALKPVAQRLLARRTPLKERR